MTNPQRAHDKKNQNTAVFERSLHGRILSPPNQDEFLDSVQLDQLEQSFRVWSDANKRSDVRESRQRILLIFLLIRFTGAKLSEVLNLDPARDIDFEKMSVFFGRSRREVQISKKLCDEARLIFADCLSIQAGRDILNMDPGFVRRKFYKRAEACGIAKQLGAPEILRKSRAIELMRNNMPLPAVQMILGHSTPNLTSSYVSFSEEDIQQVARYFVERESTPKTSARNAFFGKIRTILKGAKLWRERLKKSADIEGEADLQAGGDDTPEPETDEAAENEDTWTPEKFAGAIEGIIMYSAHFIRRARWYCLLSESSLAWAAEENPRKLKHLVTFENGRVCYRAAVGLSCVLYTYPNVERACGM